MNILFAQLIFLAIIRAYVKGRISAAFVIHHGCLERRPVVTNTRILGQLFAQTKTKIPTESKDPDDENLDRKSVKNPFSNEARFFANQIDSVNGSQNSKIDDEHPAIKIEDENDVIPSPSLKQFKDIWNSLSPILVQGDSLRTCTLKETMGRVQLLLKTDGRPLNSSLELWQGPNNIPQKMKIAIEDGNLRPLRVIIETPGSSNAICMRNTGDPELPLTTCIDGKLEGVDDNNGLAMRILSDQIQTKTRKVQGGAVFTTLFQSSVSSVQIFLKSDGRPINSRIELLQGPDNDKAVIDVYSEDGNLHPFYGVIETPGVGNVVRIVNTSPIEYPFVAHVGPYIEESEDEQPDDDDDELVWSA